MKGLELAEKYYEEYGRDMIAAIAPEAEKRIAVGLVGEGSQCFGFDDEISQDHDFAPGFCLWLEEEDFARYGQALADGYDKLPADYLGFHRSNLQIRDRMGVKTIHHFYQQFTGCGEAPQTNMDWLLIPENYLATATNGRVFRDDSGHFSSIRKKLLDFYPEDVLRKKITARAAILSQAGQYNLLRVIRRHDKTAAMLASARFCEAALSMIYLLNRSYMPFYKWAYRGLERLTLLQDTGKQLEDLVRVNALLSRDQFESAYEKAFAITETVCQAIASELNRQGLSSIHSAFLQDHLSSIMEGIQDPQLSAMDYLADCSN